jgi:putative molybdopterin biosynthesis protein
MVNRNQGSGTRILIDDLLQGKQPRGYAIQSRSHNAVAASVSQARSDWGFAIEAVATQSGLSFVQVRDEEYDFVVRSDKDSAAIDEFRQLLLDRGVREHLQTLGMRVS